jgi:hypothetical protein
MILLARAKRFGLIAIALLMTVLFSSLKANANSLIELKTVPDKVSAFEAEAKRAITAPSLTLQTNARKGTKIHLQIVMPSETPWLSTDFPIVEGKTLVEMETPLLPSGMWTLEPMLPIRGDYTIRAGTSQDNKPAANQVLKLPVGENPTKYLNFALIAIVLFAVGFAGGAVIGGKQESAPGQLAPTRVELLLSGAAIIAIVAMSALAVSAEMGVHNQCVKRERSQGPDQLIAQNSKVAFTLSGDHDTAVGDLAKFMVVVKDAHTDQPVANVPVKIAVTQLEDQFTDLAFTARTDASGQVIWKQTFFDGAPHKIDARLVGEWPDPDLKIWQNVSVEPIHPPLFRRLVTLGYMLAFLIAGMFLGFHRPLISKEKRPLNQRVTFGF